MASALAALLDSARAGKDVAGASRGVSMAFREALDAARGDDSEGTSPLSKEAAKKLAKSHSKFISDAINLYLDGRHELLDGARAALECLYAIRPAIKDPNKAFSSHLYLVLNLVEVDAAAACQEVVAFRRKLDAWFAAQENRPGLLGGGRDSASPTIGTFLAPGAVQSVKLCETVGRTLAVAALAVARCGTLELLGNGGGGGGGSSSSSRKAAASASAAKVKQLCKEVEGIVNKQAIPWAKFLRSPSHGQEGAAAAVTVQNALCSALLQAAAGADEAAGVRLLGSKSKAGRPASSTPPPGAPATALVAAHLQVALKYRGMALSAALRPWSAALPAAGEMMMHQHQGAPREAAPLVGRRAGAEALIEAAKRYASSFSSCSSSGGGGGGGGQERVLRFMKQAAGLVLFSSGSAKCSWEDAVALTEAYLGHLTPAAAATAAAADDDDDEEDDDDESDSAGGEDGYESFLSRIRSWRAPLSTDGNGIGDSVSPRLVLELLSSIGRLAAASSDKQTESDCGAIAVTYLRETFPQAKGELTLAWFDVAAIVDGTNLVDGADDSEEEEEEDQDDDEDEEKGEGDLTENCSQFALRQALEAATSFAKEATDASTSGVWRQGLREKLEAIADIFALRGDGPRQLEAAAAAAAPAAASGLPSTFDRYTIQSPLSLAALARLLLDRGLGTDGAACASQAWSLAKAVTEFSRRALKRSSSSSSSPPPSSLSSSLGRLSALWQRLIDEIGEAGEDHGEDHELPSRLPPLAAASLACGCGSERAVRMTLGAMAVAHACRAALYPAKNSADVVIVTHLEMVAASLVAGESVTTPQGEKRPRLPNLEAALDEVATVGCRLSPEVAIGLGNTLVCVASWLRGGGCLLLGKSPVGRGVGARSGGDLADKMAGLDIRGQGRGGGAAGTAAGAAAAVRASIRVAYGADIAYAALKLAQTAIGRVQVLRATSRGASTTSCYQLRWRSLRVVLDAVGALASTPPNRLPPPPAL